MDRCSSQLRMILGFFMWLCFPEKLEDNIRNLSASICCLTLCQQENWSRSLSRRGKRVFRKADSLQAFILNKTPWNELFFVKAVFHVSLFCWVTKQICHFWQGTKKRRTYFREGNQTSAQKEVVELQRWGQIRTWSLSVWAKEVHSLTRCFIRPALQF